MGTGFCSQHQCTTTKRIAVSTGYRCLAFHHGERTCHASGIIRQEINAVFYGTAAANKGVVQCTCDQLYIDCIGKQGTVFAFKIIDEVFNRFVVTHQVRTTACRCQPRLNISCEVVRVLGKEGFYRFTVGQGHLCGRRCIGRDTDAVTRVSIGVQRLQ